MPYSPINGVRRIRYPYNLLTGLVTLLGIGLQYIHGEPAMGGLLSILSPLASVFVIYTTLFIMESIADEFVMIELSNRRVIFFVGMLSFLQIEQLWSFHWSLLSMPLFALSLLYLLRSYQKKRPDREIFYYGLLSALATLNLPSLFPLFFLGVYMIYRMQVLNFRTIICYYLGWLITLWIVLPVSYFLSDEPFWISWAQEVGQLANYNWFAIDVQHLLWLVLLVYVVIVAVRHSLVYKQRVVTRTFNWTLLIQSICLITISYYNTDLTPYVYGVILSMISVLVAYLEPERLELGGVRWRRIFLIIFILTAVSLRYSNEIGQWYHYWF